MNPPDTFDFSQKDVYSFLCECPPFDSLSPEEVRKVADSAQLQTHKAGTIILDGVSKASDRLWVVVQGKVGLWNLAETEDPDTAITTSITPDEEIMQGKMFGYTVVLQGSTTGPRTVALTDVQLLRIPGKIARPIFTSPVGSAYLAKIVASNTRAKTEVQPDRTFLPVTASEMIRRKPMTGTASMSVQEAAQLMTQENSGYIVLPDAPIAGGSTGVFLLTDGFIRSKIVAEGIDLNTPLANICITEPPGMSVPADAPSVDVLSEMLENDILYLPVLSTSGRLLGVINARDYQVAPTSSSFQLRRRIEAASEVELVQLGLQIRTLIHNLASQHAPTRHICASISVLYDALERRAMSLTLQNTDLSGEEFVWFSLGSVARREAALSSDIDSAIVINSHQAEPGLKAEIVHFAAHVHKLLAKCSIPSDTNGAVASNPAFTRTIPEWKEQAHKWIKDPFADEALMKASLCLDSRPIWNFPVERPITSEFSVVSQHRGTLQLFLDEALSYRAKLHSIKDLMSMRRNIFDIKKHGLVPVVNIARWLSLRSQTSEINTVARLKAAQTDGYIDPETTSILIEAFDNLTRIRINEQLRAHEEGEEITDIINFRHLSPIDRSTITQSVREIAAVQKKLANIAHYTDLD